MVKASYASMFDAADKAREDADGRLFDDLIRKMNASLDQQTEEYVRDIQSRYDISDEELAADYILEDWFPTIEERKDLDLEKPNYDFTIKRKIRLRRKTPEEKAAGF